MNYQKPELVPLGAAITAIEAEMEKNGGIPDNPPQATVDAYQSDE